VVLRIESVTFGLLAVQPERELDVNALLIAR